jgi:putative transposase
MVGYPGDYRWSSYNHHAGNEVLSWVDTNPYYLDLATDDQRHSEAYGMFVEDGIPKAELALIRGALQRGQLTGSDRFVDEVESILGLRIESRKQGRPRKKGEK